MSAVTTTLTLEEFRRQYGNADRLEFWNGEVVEKAMPTYLHALVQFIICQLIKSAGYRVVPEVRLQIGNIFEPLPDVAAGRKRVSTLYPTTPDQIEIVVEVLSPTDRNRDVVQKCQFYQTIGIARIYVVNPLDRKAYLWDAATSDLQATDDWQLPNGRTIAMADLWREVDTENEADE